MPFKIAINGYGRIGRCILRSYYESTEYANLRICAINDIANIETLAHLTEFDSTHGRFLGEISSGDGILLVNKDVITVTNTRDIENLPWSELDIDLVMECSGTFTERLYAEKHLEAGARKVLFSQPAEKDVDATVVYGFNHDLLSEREQIISNASCTTNCFVPMVQVLDQAFGVEKGLMTTVHAYTGDQSLVDGPHSDLRRARASAVNIIPTSTGAARATGLVLQSMNGKLDGTSLRVPIPDGSITDFTAVLDSAPSVDEINEAFKVAASTAPLAGILSYSEDPLVSADIVGDPSSCVFDAGLTMTMDNLVKVSGWYDNEWGYSNRLVDLVGITCG